MEYVIGLFLAFAALLACVVCASYLNNLRLWNNGRCEENGLPWSVYEYQSGDLYLFAGHVGRRVNGVFVPSVILRNAEFI